MQHYSQPQLWLLSHVERDISGNVQAKVIHVLIWIVLEDRDAGNPSKREVIADRRASHICRRSDSCVEDQAASNC